MAEQINSASSTWRKTEQDAFANGKTGASEATATGTMVRSEDIGQASDAAAVNTTGSKSGISLWKGIFDLVSTFTRGSGNVTSNTLRVVLAGDGPTVSTLTSLLNATTLANPNTQTLPYTFTIASSTTVTNYTKLPGRVATIFIPSTVAGSSLTVLQRRVDGTGTGFTIKNNEATARTILLDQTDQTVDAESCGWLSGAIGSEIAFVSSNAQSSDQTIHVKVLV